MCEEQFLQYVKRDQSGRFIVKLPLKIDPETSLGDSKTMAIRRFLSLEKRLSVDVGLKTAYMEFLEQYEKDGHMEQTDWTASASVNYFLPHHCVLRPDKSTTKCRVIFDASAKSSTNISLNDILMVGPVVQNDLFDNLLRFRVHKFGLMADIAAMYRQIKVYPEDQQLQNIIWRAKPSDELKAYKLKTVTYGTAAEPYLATRCLLKLAEENSALDQMTANIIKNDFYVDDLITGGSTLSEINNIKQSLSSVLMQGQFELRKWYSNHQEFLTNIPEHEREKTIVINNSDVVKALGIIWDAIADAFKFNYTSSSNNHVVTKRRVLSDLSKLFDPLGIIKPLYQKIRNLIKPSDVFFWTDSVIVLGWLAEHASNLNTFVANRVSFIQENTNGVKWKYVPSTHNPADIVSRGATVQELHNSIWFSGPSFLQDPVELWPKHPKRMSCADLPERKPIKSVLLTTQQQTLLEDIYAISSFNKICIRFAYVRRFILNCRNKTHRNGACTTEVTATEIDDAFLNIVAMIQQVHYSADIHQLQHNKPLNSNSTLKALNPFLENYHGFLLLKVGGRLKNSDLPYQAKCPMILPKSNKFVEAYVRQLHLANFHAGAQALVCAIKQRFWIVGAREYARKIVQGCVLCCKYRPKLMVQLMDNLPKDRVTPVKPFTHCGVDFCGPILTTSRIRGKPKYKSYIAVFICFATRAVHLEVVSALTADAFIAALKRFVGRRGLCTTLYCDKATNFVGAKNTLKAAFFSQTYQGQLSSWCTANDITFQHIPPRSPHFGGIWEAAVKSAKSLLYKTMQSAVFTFEELSTVAAQIEGDH